MPSAFRRAVQVFIDAELSPDAQSRKLAQYAAAATAALIANGQASPQYLEFVDGVQGGDPNAVRRVIADQFGYTGAAAVFALAFLRARSPSRSGRFRSSFMVAVNGKPVAGDAFDPAQVPVGAEVILYNPQPYARKIDVQLIGTKRMHFSVPAGLYDDAVSAVRDRFGNAVKASRTYAVRIPGAYILKTGRNRGAAVQTPALVLDAIL